MPSTTPNRSPQADGIGPRRRVRRRRAPLWLRLRYRLRGARYGHTPLTDPTNVQMRVVDEQ